MCNKRTFKVFKLKNVAMKTINFNKEYHLINVDTPLSVKEIDVIIHDLIWKSPTMHPREKRLIEFLYNTRHEIREQYLKEKDTKKSKEN